MLKVMKCLTCWKIGDRKEKIKEERYQTGELFASLRNFESSLVVYQDGRCNFSVKNCFCAPK